MSCPHPRPPVERVVGNFSEIVCPDCHARFASVIEFEAVKAPSRMNLAELRGLADVSGVEVPDSATKAQIRELLGI